MAVTTHKVTVHDGAIASLFFEGGDVARFGARVTREMKAEAILEAPIGQAYPASPGRLPPGTLKRSHEITQQPRGRYQYRGSVINTARHAEWVHGGTPTIFPRSGGRLRVPLAGGGGAAVLTGDVRPVVFPRSVRGQSANPWLDRAATRVARRYA